VNGERSPSESDWGLGEETERRAGVVEGGRERERELQTAGF